MKAIFNKVIPSLRHKGKPSNDKTGHYLYHFTNLREIQLQSVIGYLAMKMSQLIDWEPQQSEEIFYHSFTYIQRDKEAKDDLLYLGGLLLNWILEEKDIKENLAMVKLPVNIEKAAIKVYETCKDELEGFKYSLNKKINKSFSLESSEWEIYRDIIFAATQRKLLLISQSDIKKKSEGIVLYSGVIKERADVSICRKDIQQIFLKMRIKQNHMMHWLLAISELTTNCIKHANGGCLTVRQNQQHIYIILEDKGPGFNLKDLPNMTLISGYSTKNSMGQGFNLMMKMAEHIMLSNTDSGACIILKFTMKEGENDGGSNEQNQNI